MSEVIRNKTNDILRTGTPHKGVPVRFFGLIMMMMVYGFSCTKSSPPSAVHSLKEQASDFLWAQQGEDGGWHSKTHGLLKGGQALTPFILYVLLQADPGAEKTRKGDVERAFSFLRSHTNEAGILGRSDPLVMEYPNYATSYAIRLFAEYGDHEDKELAHAMYSYLIDQQFDTSRAIDTSHVAFGGWGFGEVGLPKGQVGYVDISHTRRVIQSLVQANNHLAPSGSLDRTTQQALHFLHRLQKRGRSSYDGGFYYSPVVHLANKGTVEKPTSDDPVFGSYATATCDGLLALLAAGASVQSEAIKDAWRWLSDHPVLDYPEGIPLENPAQWHRVMYFYHLSVRAEVYHHMGWPAGSKEAILSLLSTRMLQNGSFMNPEGAPNKENDPLLATSLALIALHYLSLS